MMTLIKTIGNASLYRNKSYNDRAKPETTWWVKHSPTNLFVCAVKRKKDALEYLENYSKKS